MTNGVFPGFIAWKEPNKKCTMGDKVKTSKSLFLWYTIQIPAHCRTSVWQVQPVPLTTVHPLPRLGAQWMSPGSVFGWVHWKKVCHIVFHVHTRTTHPEALTQTRCVWKQLCWKGGAEKYCRLHIRHFIPLFCRDHVEVKFKCWSSGEV